MSGFGLSVLIPNFTFSPDLSGSIAVKIRTCSGVFWADQPVSDLNDLTKKSVNQILNDLRSSVPWFVN